jgi:hypothetical protein
MLPFQLLAEYIAVTVMLDKLRLKPRPKVRKLA